MPVYDYVCKDCQKSFELILTLGEHDKGDILCPKCGSKNVEQDACRPLRGDIEEELESGRHVESDPHGARRTRQFNSRSSHNSVARPWVTAIPSTRVR